MIRGAILAGGAGRRMGGRPKALLPFGGEPLLLRQLREMSRLCAEVFVVTNAPETLQPALQLWPPTADGGGMGASVRCIPDAWPGAGPLAGLHAAAAEAGAGLIWVVGCDMPHVSAPAAAALAARCFDAGVEAAVPRLGGRIHPLHGVYAAEPAAAEAAALLGAGERRMMALLERLRYVWAEEEWLREQGIGPGFATNWNTPEDVFGGEAR
ncbi:NTP transferase domain-containing protein [Paenibacillus athensensis]|uniref:MobA-like NTP transferase domain-containing protein n=1 Tax=Paenibacillus athensensis TaxID=1967502 RepID=A0A4Y8PXQ3_9BACL|nr:NTP transferase domain-containing protein [Paenibacillus athensensis]MCD1259940.1 NTP transferase domain-containing protein [Paenibacillus athensensis]